MKTQLPPLLKLATARNFQLMSLSLTAVCWLSAVPAQAATPPDPLIELRFPEGTDVVTTNTGTLGENAFFNITDTNNYPGFSTNLPVGAYVPAGNLYSVDMGPFVAGTYGRAVDMTNSIGYLPAMSQLTICGWLNARDIARNGKIAYALETPNGLGFDLANDSIGRLTLGVNESSGNNPSVLRLTTDLQTGTNNWVFFAVTYDSTLMSNQLSYYFGRGDKLAYLDSAYTYVGGYVDSTIGYAYSPSFGNYSTADQAERDTTSAAGSGIFRGLMDELKVYTNAFTLDQVQQAQLDGTVTPVAASILRPPANKTVPQGLDAAFDVDASGSGALTYQWKTNSVNVPGATNSSFTLSSVTLAQIGLQVRVGVTNAVGGVLRLPSHPHRPTRESALGILIIHRRQCEEYQLHAHAGTARPPLRHQCRWHPDRGREFRAKTIDGQRRRHLAGLQHQRAHRPLCAEPHLQPVFASHG